MISHEMQQIFYDLRNINKVMINKRAFPKKISIITDENLNQDKGLCKIYYVGNFISCIKLAIHIT